MGIIRYLLSASCKQAVWTSKRRGEFGFTLLELLVSIILATLVITPLLGFMIDILQTDRREQSKTATEQELRTAAEYIARDLSEAVYIYDDEGLAAITGNYAETTCTGSACDSSITGPSNLPSRNLPGFDGSVPVLVFWKRAYLSKNRELLGRVADPNNNDGFVYSLVAYYLINNADALWSNSSRIARFEVKGPLRDASGSTIILPEQAGYEPLDFNLGALQDVMRGWHKSETTNYNFAATSTPLTVLVDYIDLSNSTVPTSALFSSDLSASIERCPNEDLNRNGVIDGAETDANGNGVADIWTQVPDYDALPATYNALKTHGFYACVKASEPGQNNIARVFLRGNALARLGNNNDIPVYKDGVANYFPRVRIEVKGNGNL
ncbi:MAG: hormogonium polysaccharide secretion pseudopilin HpsC [Leptolyngbyaceae cyanobacterium MO_188.B28]|nr:hormogonium polysaccharide secretion pseudopilin HpsC [Leptolyngbyaceae cyanobacterium MO_188.B28]